MLKVNENSIVMIIVYILLSFLLIDVILTFATGVEWFPASAWLISNFVIFLEIGDWSLKMKIRKKFGFDGWFYLREMQPVHLTHAQEKYPEVYRSVFDKEKTIYEYYSLLHYATKGKTGSSEVPVSDALLKKWNLT